MNISSNSIASSGRIQLPLSSELFGKGSVALITGANKGIGFETARKLGRLCITVLVGARDVTRGEAATSQFKAEGADAFFLELDITKQSSIEEAARTVESRYGKLDILINNAAIVHRKVGGLSEESVDELRGIFETNFFSAFSVTKAFEPLLRRSKHPRIVNVSSELGSLTLTGDPASPFSAIRNCAYTCSKAALNMLTVQMSNELSKDGFRVNSANPGYCATDLNQHTGHRTAEQGAVASFHLATLADDGPTGQFFEDEGSLPW